MKRIQTPLRLLFMTVAALHLAACSKTIQWEEEVPLNAGETIWVKRTVVYSPRGGAGNPFDIAYRPERNETLEFTWNGKRFRYEGDARVMLLAIAPDRKPVLVANAADNSWDAVHRYACTLPYYVQLIPQADGRTWTWPPQIDKWLYNLPPNLLLSRHSPNRMLGRYTAAQRVAEDTPGASGIPSKTKIDPNYVGDVCRNNRRK